jgi:hypothetical protein
VIAQVPSFTPPGLLRDPQHVYTLDGRVQAGTTSCLAAVGLIDTSRFTPDDRMRGTRVHDAIARWNDGRAQNDWPFVGGYVRGYQRFLSESAFRLDAHEEMLCDPQLRVAGTLDLRGQFIDGTTVTGERIDIVDCKTGGDCPWVGYQTAGYVRMLPMHLRPLCRRWSLVLRADATYKLEPLRNRNDETVFVAAVTITHARRGWL